MRIDDFRDEVNAKLDRIESKLDIYGTKLAAHEADLGWTKGFLKFGLTLLTTAIGAIITHLVRGIH